MTREESLAECRRVMLQGYALDGRVHTEVMDQQPTRWDVTGPDGGKRGLQMGHPFSRAATKEEAEQYALELPPHWHAVAVPDVPAYSRDIEDAWPVIDRLRTLGWTYCTVQSVQKFDGDEPVDGGVQFWCEFSHATEPNVVTGDTCDDAPHAICSAALKVAEQTRTVPLKRASGDTNG